MLLKLVEGLRPLAPARISSSSEGAAGQAAAENTWQLFRQTAGKPFHARTCPYSVKLFHWRGYVVKQYKGYRRKVLQELALLQRLAHQGLTTYEFFVDEGSRISIFMPWAGTDLRQHRGLSTSEYSEAVARHMAYQLAQSLCYLHQQGVIHRDVKPDNIGVQPGHALRLFDWGEAVTLADVHGLPERQLMRDVGVAGTPLFMAPEALNYLTRRGPQGAEALRTVLTTKLDIWGLGCVIYFLLAGRDVFINDSSWELEAIADLVNSSRGLSLPDGCAASPAARDFLAACFERDPEARPSAKQLLQHPWLLGASSAAELAAAKAAAGAQRGSRPRLLVRVAGAADSDDERSSGACTPTSLASSSSGASAGSSLAGERADVVSSANMHSMHALRQGSLESATICEIKLAPSASTSSLRALALSSAPGVVGSTN